MPKGKTKKEDEEEASPLQVAAFFCIIVGIAQLATTYTGILELFGGYVTGIVCIATGVTLFAFDKSPDKTLQILKMFFDFLLKIFKGLAAFVRSRLSKE